MNLVDPTTAQPTVTKAVKPGTPSGAYSDPAQVGSMIQSMYPQYKSMDAVTLGQRWIDLHTPHPAAGAAGSGTDMLSGPIGTTPMTSTDPNSPDLSGLAQFASPIKPAVKPKPQLAVKIAPTAGMSQMTQGNQLTGQPQQNSPWIGQQIVSGIQNMFKAPQLNIPAKPAGY